MTRKIRKTFLDDDPLGYFCDKSLDFSELIRFYCTINFEKL